jgi:hypothetical protein
MLDCGEGDWFNYEGYCLHGTSTAMTAYEAHDFCIACGGRMVLPLSYEMDIELGNFAEGQAIGSSFWIGINDVVNENR